MFGSIMYTLKKDLSKDLQAKIKTLKGGFLAVSKEFLLVAKENLLIQVENRKKMTLMIT